MNFSSLLNIVGLVLNAVGAVSFGLAFMILNKTINEISSTKWDENSDVERWLKCSRTQGIVGLCFLVVGFCIQIWAQFLQ